MIQVRATPRRPCEPTEEEVDAAMRIDPRPTPQHIPVGNHGEYGSTGAGAARRKRWRDGVVAGIINPHTKDLQDAEKQLRGQCRRGAEVSNIVNAQLKVENMVERMELWERHKRGEDFDYMRRRGRGAEPTSRRNSGTL